MRSATAYFAGAGTVIAAIAAGLGGGLLISDIVSPQQEKHGSLDTTRLDRRASPEPIPAASKALEPVPYLAAPQVSAAVAGSPPQQAASEQPPPQPPAPPTTQAAAPPAPSSPPAASPPAAQPVAAADPSAAREKAAPEESYAKAREADVKREPRRAEEKRRGERRQQWADRRKPRARDGDDLRDVERAIREDTETRQSPAVEPVRMEMPRIRLFDRE